MVPFVVKKIEWFFVKSINRIVGYKLHSVVSNIYLKMWFYIVYDVKLWNLRRILNHLSQYNTVHWAMRCHILHLIIQINWYWLFPFPGFLVWISNIFLYNNKDFYPNYSLEDLDVSFWFLLIRFVSWTHFSCYRGINDHYFFVRNISYSHSILKKLL